LATPLEAGGLGSVLIPVLVFLFVFVIVFALLKKTGFFGKSDGAVSLFAFVVSLMTIMVPESNVIIANFIPWMMLFFVLVLFIFLFFMFLGVKGDSMIHVAKDSTFVVTAIVMTLVIFLIAMTKAYGPFLMVSGNAGFWESTKRAIFNARFLGIIFMLMVAHFTVKFIADSSK
tara:strand:- start:1474 stop:1992 length:519 start_codon:yes stop_codon:yes gene_type:complete